MDVKTAIQRQFGRAAARYAESPVHAGGPDLDALLEAAALAGRERVLDLGCGVGHTALAVSERAAEVVGVDLTAPMLEVARELARGRGARNVRFVRADVEQLPFGDGAFDVVTSRFSAHHYPSPAKALLEAARALAPGGIFLLIDTVAPEEPALDTFLNAIERVRDPSHVRDHRVSEWRAMLEANGFDAELVASWPLQLDFEAWVERSAAAPAAVKLLRRLFEAAPREAREAFAVRARGGYDFVIPIALLRGVRRSGAST